MTTAPQVGLARVVHRSARAPQTVHNASDAVLLLLPSTSGRIRITRGPSVVFDGVARPGMVRVVRPGERRQVAPATTLQSALLTVPQAVLPWSQIAAADPVFPARPEIRGLGLALEVAVDLPAPQRDRVALGVTMALAELLLLHEPERRRDVGRLTAAQLRLAADFASANVASGVTLMEWSAVLQMPPREFTRRFRRSTGMTPYAWFTQRRVDVAKRLLITTDLPVAQIAARLGYSGQSHFTDTFRKQVGTAPGRWRRAQRR